MFNKRKKKYSQDIYTDGFLGGINYVLHKLSIQKEQYGSIANIDDLVDLITKDL